MSALRGITVVELGRHRSGPYCTRLMAGFGARVIKVEAPGDGDPSRHCGPFAGDVPDPERSLPFHWLNAGKQSVTLDWQCAKGRELLHRLLAIADVVVQNPPAGSRDVPTLGYEAARDVRRDVIMTTITDFGGSGPCHEFAADEMVLYAMSGCMSTTGDAERPPLAAGPAVAQYTAAMHAYLGNLVALFQRGQTGNGAHVEISVQESVMENMELHLANYFHKGNVAKRNGDDHQGVPWRTYPCRDGYATVIGAPLRNWPRGAGIFEEPRLLEPHLRHVSGRIEKRREVEALMRPWLERHDRREIYEAGQAHGLAFGYVASIPEAAGSPQLEARGFFAASDPHPELGSLTMPGPPYGLSSASWRTGRAPLLGEHTGSILADELGYGDEEMETLRGEGVI